MCSRATEHTACRGHRAAAKTERTRHCGRAASQACRCAPHHFACLCFGERHRGCVEHGELRGHWPWNSCMCAFMEYRGDLVLTRRHHGDELRRTLDSVMCDVHRASGSVCGPRQPMGDAWRHLGLAQSPSAARFSGAEDAHALNVSWPRRTARHRPSTWY